MTQKGEIIEFLLERGCRTKGSELGKGRVILPLSTVGLSRFEGKELFPKVTVPASRGGEKNE